MDGVQVSRVIEFSTNPQIHHHTYNLLCTHSGQNTAHVNFSSVRPKMSCLFDGSEEGHLLLLLLLCVLYVIGERRQDSQ